MKRSAALIPLSHDHHLALEVALRLKRADPADLESASARFYSFWDPDGLQHFAVEERLLVDALPQADPGWRKATARLHADHARIRELAAALSIDAALETAHELGQMLANHVRFEERELFVELETRLPPEALDRLGAEISSAMTK